MSNISTRFSRFPAHFSAFRVPLWSSPYAKSLHQMSFILEYVME